MKVYRCRWCGRRVHGIFGWFHNSKTCSERPRYICINGHDSRTHGVRMLGIVDSGPIYECGAEECHAEAELVPTGSRGQT